MSPPSKRNNTPQKSFHYRNDRRGGSAGVGGRGSAMLFGLHAVGAAWTNPERHCRKLLVTDSGAQMMAEAIAAAQAQGLERPSPTIADKTELDRMLPGAVHQGIALDAEPLAEIDVDDVIRSTEGLPHAAVVVLDQVTDPHNVGAVLRSAAAFGAAAVLVTERHAPEVTGVLAKAASGALEVVPLVRVTNLARALTDLRDAGFWCVGLAESGTRLLSESGLGGRCALVLGAEGSGLRRLTRERCDELVRLPTRAPIGSLNVSNAAAVALYETARNRPEATPDGSGLFGQAEQV